MGGCGRYIVWLRPALYLYFIGVVVVLDWIIYIAMLTCCLCGLIAICVYLLSSLEFGKLSVDQRSHAAIDLVYFNPVTLYSDSTVHLLHGGVGSLFDSVFPAYLSIHRQCPSKYY
jgi:hypothetical protein